MEVLGDPEPAHQPAVIPVQLVRLCLCLQGTAGLGKFRQACLAQGDSSPEGCSLPAPDLCSCWWSIQLFHNLKPNIVDLHPSWVNLALSNQLHFCPTVSHAICAVSRWSWGKGGLLFIPSPTRLYVIACSGNLLSPPSHEVVPECQFVAAASGNAALASFAAWECHVCLGGSAEALCQLVLHLPAQVRAW